ncbi:putative glutathione S-transferase [Prunus yedoensis var. nudiflora]|uniref:Glutathione S-transferase n=1 Tax=Prunus yedoensis var. nudiflora TaxID=2094558 RepID=A0A314YR61_PRUYE|nr:putative glutathione S-transferase [Prunus yedoensis var. nudiflora]
MLLVLDGAFTALIFSTGEQQEKALKSTIEALEHIEGDLMGKKILGGESIGYLDIAMGWMSYWLPIWEEVGSRQVLDPSKFPATISWMNKILSHPLIKDNLPPRDKTVAYFHGRRNFFTSGKT